jgi:hypothetical protein
MGGSMPKRNIYFTDDLVAQMKKHPDEKWSAVCQEAVETRLRYLELRSDIASDAVQRAKARLATERAAYIADAYYRGERDGIAWAADHAAFDELRGIESAGGLEEWPFDGLLDDGEDSLRLIAKLACDAPPDTLGDETLTADENAFILSLCNAIGLRMDGADIESARYWGGFVAGALAIFRQL